MGALLKSDRRLRILLAEDDAVISALIVEILADFGHDVCGITRSEQETIAAATQHAPDLMIVDAHLNDGSGVSAMNAILRHAAMPHIFMTGGGRHALPPQAIVLHKPFAAADLKALLDQVDRQMPPAGGSVHTKP